MPILLTQTAFIIGSIFAIRTENYAEQTHGGSVTPGALVSVMSQPVVSQSLQLQRKRYLTQTNIKYNLDIQCIQYIFWSPTVGFNSIQNFRQIK